MNTEEIKWISYYGKDIGTVNRSFREKVNKFGFCLVLDEYGSDKASKAQLCILDAVQNKETPNILLVCPGHLMHNWYRSIVTKDGIDFKMVSGASRTIYSFSEAMSNLFIVSEDAVKSDNAILSQFAASGLIWDLMIIDAGLNIAGVESAFYLDHIKSKTEKLVVFSPVPCDYKEDYTEIKSLVKGLMNDESKAEILDRIEISKNAICFDTSEPIMRYFDSSVYSGDVSRNVVLLEYAFDKEFISNSRKLVDIKTGLPLYQHGGNIFEEYGLEAKKTYTKPAYNTADVVELREVDKKLDCFLTKLEDIMKSPDNKAVVYCVTNTTIAYLSKVLAALYPLNSNMVRIDRGDIFNTKYDNFTTAGTADNARIVLTVDRIGSIKPQTKNYTHIFNYELPHSPVVFEQRAARHGGVDEGKKEFIVFCDENGLFDSRMLSKVLFGKIYKGLVKGLPGRNVLFDLPNALQLIVNCIRDLQYVCGYTGEVTGSLDVITQFRGDYNIIPSIDVSTSVKAHEYTDKKLQKIYNAFGIANQIKGYSTDEKTLKSILKPILDSYKGSLLYLDEEKRIVAVSGEELEGSLAGDKYEQYKQQIATDELSNGIKAAQSYLSSYISENKSAELRYFINGLPDIMKLPVLLGAWKYLTDEYIIQDTFKEFIKKYNEGVM